MEIMGKCPYFGEPCLKEDCASFIYDEHCLYDDPDREDYRHFRKEKKFRWGNPTEKAWFAVDIPYCRTLKIQLPIDKSDKPEATPMPDGGVYAR